MKKDTLKILFLESCKYTEIHLLYVETVQFDSSVYWCVKYYFMSESVSRLYAALCFRHRSTRCCHAGNIDGRILKYSEVARSLTVHRPCEL